MLQPLPLGGGGGAGEVLEAAVDLQRVGGHGDRVLAAPRAGGRRARSPRRSSRRRSGRRSRTIVGGCGTARSIVVLDARAHRHRLVDEPRPARGRARGGADGAEGPGGRVLRPGVRVRLRHPSGRAGGRAGGGTGGARAGRARRLRGGGRDRGAARGRDRHRRVGLGGPPRWRLGDHVPRAGRGARGGRGSAVRDAGARRRRGRDPARRPGHASRPTPCCASWPSPLPTVPLVGGLASARTAGGGDRAVPGRGGRRRGRGRRAARRRRDASRACRRARRRSGRS